MVLCDNKFKVVLLGDSGVGKSTLLLQFTEHEFTSMRSTVGIDYRKSRMCVENEEIILDIWDTAGQERYRSLTQNHFRNTQGVVLMYAVDDERSYQNVLLWQHEIERLCPPETRVLIIGNKCDLSGRVVPVEQGLKLSSELGAPFMESSAKDNVNVQTTFHLLAKMMIDERRSNSKSDEMKEMFEQKIKSLQNEDCCQKSVENTFQTMQACCQN